MKKRKKSSEFVSLHPEVDPAAASFAAACGNVYEHLLERYGIMLTISEAADGAPFFHVAGSGIEITLGANTRAQGTAITMKLNRAQP